MQAVLPLASSQSPSSGDHFLLQRFEDIQQNNNLQQTYIRALLSGTGEFFCIMIVDAGFVADLRNKPREVHSLPTLPDICRECNCVLLHTSTKHEPYVLARDHQNRIVQEPPDHSRDPTAVENSVKFTRIFRAPQEQIHATLKSRFRFLDNKHISNSSLFALKPQQLQRFGLPPSYGDVPKLSYIALVCCSQVNQFHPGYDVLYIHPNNQIDAGNRLLKRVFQKNPLLHEHMWPPEIKFDVSSAYWTSSTFGQMYSQNLINFPRLETNQINPIATDIASGPHALEKGFSLATYMGQLRIKEQRLNLSRQETEVYLQNFPNEWQVQYCYVRTPTNFVPTASAPRWCPPLWDAAFFGDWPGDLCFVRAKIPPSHKSATQPSNFHYAVIGFLVGEGLPRLGLMPPYDRIVMWRCWRCPALNGIMSMCRHLGTLLCGVSFPQAYRSTFRSINLLDTVADVRRQTTMILPPTTTSQPIPENIPRRSVNVRAGQPLYDTSTASTASSSSTTTTSSTSTSTISSSTTSSSSTTITTSTTTTANVTAGSFAAPSASQPITSTGPSTTASSPVPASNVPSVPVSGPSRSDRGLVRSGGNNIF